ncbi:Protein of unknown function [Gryllus bimaculatus]|nr:Protein of unknown function [Gryllus bimaculatus]
MSSGDEGATQPALGAYDDPDHEDFPRAGTSAQRSSTGALPKAGTSAQRSSAVRDTPPGHQLTLADPCAVVYTYKVRALWLLYPTPSRMLSREAEGSGRPTPSPSPPPAASARDEQLAAALVVASLHEPEMGADMSVSAKVLARKWWARTFNARRMQHWLRKRKNILL